MSIAAEYLETQVLTATPHRLHQMVLDAAIRWARCGLEALNEQRWGEMDAAFSRSRDCVTELIGGLRPNRAPELVERLKLLLLFVYRSLIEGDLHRDPAQIRNALHILEMHRQTWLEVGEAAAGQTAPAIPTPHARSWLG